MAESEITTADLRDRLKNLLADWGADLTSLVAELEEKRERVAELEAAAAGHGHTVETLSRRLEAQDKLIESLNGDADEAASLRKEIHEKDVDLEKMAAEIDSKDELIAALRRDADKVGRMTGDSRAKKKEIERLTQEKTAAETHAAELSEEFKALSAATIGDINSKLELHALRAELEARKTLIQSLRVDADRAKQLEAQLDEKRAVIGKLEASVDQHVRSLAEMRESVAKWKARAAETGSDPGRVSATATGASGLTDEELDTLRSLGDIDHDIGATTVTTELAESFADSQRIEPKITTNR
ncbi:MAG TPA: hypothetical protein VIV14_11360 [Gammaproteobacteria bacterium]